MVKQADETPILIAQAGPLNGHQWVLDSDILLGRGTSCNIVIPDRQVSRHHARISILKGKYFLEDLHSKNGTHINGKQIQQGTYLNDGDVVQIALAQEIVFISADSTIPLNAGATKSQSPRKMLQIEKRSRRVWVLGKELTPALSVAQFTILEILDKNEGRVVSRDQLTEAVWGIDGAIEVSAQALDALIRRLRNRLMLMDKAHEYIVTVRGHGLRLDNPEH